MGWCCFAWWCCSLDWPVAVGHPACCKALDEGHRCRGYPTGDRKEKDGRYSKEPGRSRSLVRPRKTSGFRFVGEAKR